jgi:hypothetical protein
MAAEEKKSSTAALLEEDIGSEDTDEDESEGGGGDDDDDDDEEAAKPFLIGKLKVDEENRLSWAGKWAMTSDDYKEGNHSKFKVTGPVVVGNSVPSPPPDTCVFNGYFAMKNEHTDSGRVKIKERDVTVTFKADPSGAGQFTITGTGVNDFGTFSLVGKYDSSSHIMEATKMYTDTDDDQLDEQDIEDAKEELAGLQEEANMTVEQLRERYSMGPTGGSGSGGGGSGSGGGGSGSGGGGSGSGASGSGEPAAKRQKVEDDDDYDEF